MFKQAKWIWQNNNARPDEYAEFETKFHGSEKSLNLRLSCDGNFAVWVNGELLGFGQYPDYPYYKIVEEYEINNTKVLENTLKIIVWHNGSDFSQTYVKASAGLIFEIKCGEEIIVASSKKTLSKISDKYLSHYEKVLTNQLGYSFLFDSTAVEKPYGKSVEVKKCCKFYPRPIEKLLLCGRAETKTTELKNNYLIDFGKETVGQLDLEFFSTSKQKIIIVYGERLTNDGNVPRIIGGRDFSVEYIAKQGTNNYFNPFRRLAGRYMQVFLEQKIEPIYLGLQIVKYPFKRVMADFSDELQQKIYDVSAYTLECCAHEHYEDCPWREQALYTMDSRNQMLCGYYAFEGFEYARANLILISKGLREDGLLSICYPTSFDIPIPFFSLVYPIQVCEYVRYSKDESILPILKPVIERIFATFINNKDERGLIANFPYPAWNFYEWAEGGDNGMPIKSEYVKKFDLNLNAMFIYAAEIYHETTGIEIDVSKTRAAVRESFLRNGIFVNTENDALYTKLGNSLAILSGVCDRSEEVELADKLVAKDCEAVDTTLSMRTFYYDALLKVDAEKYNNYILSDIEEKYSFMLNDGATTFWEVLDKNAWDGAASQCHGWSAIPIYYYNILIKGKEKGKKI